MTARLAQMHQGSVPQEKSTLTLDLNGHSVGYEVGTHNVLADTVSNNVPLQRFLGTLVRVRGRIRKYHFNH